MESAVLTSNLNLLVDVHSQDMRSPMDWNNLWLPRDWNRDSPWSCGVEPVAMPPLYPSPGPFPNHRALNAVGKDQLLKAYYEPQLGDEWEMNGSGGCKQFPSSQYITIHVCNITAGDYPHIYIYNLSSLLGLYMFILSKHYEVELRRETYWFVGINGKWQITMYIFGFNCWQVWLVLLFFRVCFTAICHPTWDEDRHEYVFQGLGHPEQTGIESIN